MIGRLIFSGVLVFLLSSCARPKYEVVESPREKASQERDLEDCEALFKNSGYCVLWSWELFPSASTAGSLIFKIVRANVLDGSPIPVDTEILPQLILWMPSMGHGSTPTFVERVDTGSFRAKNVFFIMPGEWELRFQLKEGDSVQDEAVVTLSI